MKIETLCLTVIIYLITNALIFNTLYYKIDA